MISGSAPAFGDFVFVGFCSAGVLVESLIRLEYVGGVKSQFGSGAKTQRREERQRDLGLAQRRGGAKNSKEGIGLNTGEFTRVAERALATLPDEFRKHAMEVALVIEPYPSEELCDEMELEEDEDLFG